MSFVYAQYREAQQRLHASTLEVTTLKNTEENDHCLKICECFLFRVICQDTLAPLPSLIAVNGAPSSG